MNDQSQILPRPAQDGDYSGFDEAMRQAEFERMADRYGRAQAAQILIEEIKGWSSQ